MSRIETFELRPGVDLSRIIRGGWQLAGGHGPVDRAAAVEDLLASFKAGIFTFDCADIYTGVEELIGAVRARLLAEAGTQAVSRLRVHTKLVPDLGILGRLRRADVAAIVDRSLQRLRTERLDLVQFHWWDYAVPGWLDAMGWLDELRRAGKIADLGATNFDTPHLAAIVGAGIPLRSMQTQYSLLDTRPATSGFAEACQARGVVLLCYGTVAGGFLGDRWRGLREPEALENRSLVKYKLIIDDFGGWDLFQALLAALRGIADRHGSDIASVATRWVLDRPNVAAAIVGARNTAHLDRHAAIGALRLDEADHAALAAVLRHRTGPLGEPYGLERDRTGRHGRIMKYDLNAVTA
jgi:aryl-alcohol dehydrogenase-like predicted oxidoreductase